jgi:Flp pilus assembly protein TadG
MYFRATNRRGAAAAELAVLLPFVALLFTVAVDFCRLYYQTQTVYGCAEAGACYAAGYAWPNQADAGAAPNQLPPVQPDSDAARIEAAQLAAVAEGAGLNPPLPAANVQVTIANGNATVTVSYDCAMLTPVLGASRVQTVTRSVTMTKIR